MPGEAQIRFNIRLDLRPTRDGDRPPGPRLLDPRQNAAAPRGLFVPRPPQPTAGRENSGGWWLMPGLTRGDESMHKDWPRIATELSVAVKEVRGGAPDAMKAFSALARAALEPKALTTKTKELIALAISVATRCDPCIAFHAEAALRQGATRDELMETMGIAIYMGAGPSVMYAAQAIEAYDQFAARNFAGSTSEQLRTQSA